MLLTIVAWPVFAFTSLLITWAVLDTFCQFGISELKRTLGLRRHYMTGRMFIVAVFWGLSAWVIFG